VNTFYKHEQILAENTFLYESEQAVCVWQNHWLPEQTTTEITLDIFQRQGELYARTQECFAERAYSTAELTAWLQKAGFELLHVYGELTFAPPKAHDERIFFVARRKGVR
jgi:hypothetical protein